MTLRQSGNEGRVSFTYLIGQSVGAEVTQRQLEFLELLVDRDLDSDKRIRRRTAARSLWCRHSVGELCRGVRLCRSLVWRWQLAMTCCYRSAATAARLG